VVDHTGYLQAAHSVYDTLTYWMLSQEPTLKSYPEHSLVEFSDFIATAAFVDLLLVL
jgi:hypothetical protein